MLTAQTNSQHPGCCQVQWAWHSFQLCQSLVHDPEVATYIMSYLNSLLRPMSLNPSCKLFIVGLCKYIEGTMLVLGIRVKIVDCNLETHMSYVAIYSSRSVASSGGRPEWRWYSQALHSNAHIASYSSPAWLHLAASLATCAIGITDTTVYNTRGALALTRCVYQIREKSVRR